MATITCRKCSKNFSHNKQGRPPVICLTCKGFPEKPIESDQALVGLSDKLKDSRSGLSFVTTEQAYEQMTKSFQGVTKIIESDLTDSKNIISIPVVGKIDYPYEVVVTNMGFAYQGDSEKEANKIYELYIKKSKIGFGQVGMENVMFYHHNVLAKIFDYRKSDDVKITDPIVYCLHENQSVSDRNVFICNDCNEELGR